MTQPIHVRAATMRDTASIASLVTELGYPTTASEMRSRLVAIDADASYRTLVADIDGEIVGVAGVAVAPMYERDGLYGRLMALAVSGSHRGSGVGRALVRAAEDWVVERGGSVMLVNTSHRRQDAHAFYQRLGYLSTGLRFVRELKN